MRPPTLAGLLCGLALLLLVSGCVPGGARYAAAQKPGAVTGAGVDFTSPANAAEPSRISAQRTATYRWPSFADLSAPPVTGAPSADAAALPAPGSEAPAEVTVTEEFSAEMGAHQDLAGILKQAAKLVSSWAWLRWVGIVTILGSGAFALWSMQNPAGYTVVGLGGVACGVVFLFASANPAWLLLLAAPFLFYLVQKLGLLRLPEDAR